MSHGLFRIAAFEKQEAQPVVRTSEIRFDLERAAIAARGFILSIRARVSDRHVLQNAMIVWLLAQREPIRRKRSLVVALPLKEQGFFEIVDALRLELAL